MVHRQPNPPRVLCVYLPNDNVSPLTLVGELLAEIGLPKIEVGVDPLTGGVEFRIPYSARTLENIRRFLNEREAVYDISPL
jgi:hypothetical protein